jgi:hypothetical protein
MSATTTSTGKADNVQFHHSLELWSRFPTLVPAVLAAKDITPDASVADQVAGTMTRVSEISV